MTVFCVNPIAHVHSWPHDLKVMPISGSSMRYSSVGRTCCYPTITKKIITRIISYLVNSSVGTKISDKFILISACLINWLRYVWYKNTPVSSAESYHVTHRINIFWPFLPKRQWRNHCFLSGSGLVLREVKLWTAFQSVCTGTTQVGPL